jgi:hypothetical protein
MFGQDSQEKGRLMCLRRQDDEIPAEQEPLINEMLRAFIVPHMVESGIPFIGSIILTLLVYVF